MVDKKDIVVASTKLFATNGFDATSVSDISKAIGLSPSAGGIYRHFKSKRAIFDAIFDDYYENYGAFLGEVNSNVSSSLEVNKRDLARTLLELSLKQAKTDVDIIKLYFKERSRLKEKHIVLAANLRETSIAAFTLVCKYISGSEADFDAEAAAAILIDSINFRVSEFAPDHGISEDRYISSLTDLLYSLVVGNED